LLLTHYLTPVSWPAAHAPTVGRLQVESMFLNMPNLHFLPCAPVGCKFEDDVYVATSEPHGNIEGEQLDEGT
jgi:hypothetical protein